jgi:hypothetical protein
LNLPRSDSDAAPSIKESMLAKVHALDAEIDRQRTRVEVVTGLLVGLCAAVGEGAKKLGPAVRLTERIVGALARLGPPEPAILALPAPEALGLDDEASDGRD